MCCVLITALADKGMMMPTPYIQLDNINIADRLYVNQLALFGGTITHIIGQNGAGKSTLLEVMAGLLSVNTTSRLATGSTGASTSSILPNTPAAQVAQYRCCLTQANHSVFVLTVAELFAFYTPHTQAPIELDSILEVNQFLLRSMDELSTGQRQRVHLARCMMQIWDAVQRGEGILLFDEPFDALDLAYQLKWMNWLHTIKQRGNVIVIVHHQLVLLQDCPDDDVIIVNAGQIVEHGQISRVWNKTCLTQHFALSEYDIPSYLSFKSA